MNSFTQGFKLVGALTVLGTLTVCVRTTMRAPVSQSMRSSESGTSAASQAFSKPSAPSSHATTESPAQALAQAPPRGVSGNSPSRPASQPTGDEQGPRLPDPDGIPDPEYPPGEDDDHAGRPDCGQRDGMSCCQDRYCRYGLRCRREGRRPAINTVCRTQTPPPPTRVVAFSENRPVAGGLFGTSENRVFGGECPRGTTRRACFAISTSGGHCEFVSWVSASPTDCRCTVHFGVPAVQGLDCAMQITAGAP